MPQLDPSVYPSQLFWLVLTFVPLYLILRRAVLPRIAEVLGARQRHIDTDLEKAGSLKEEADKVMAEYEKSLAEAREQAATTLKQASGEMAAQSAKRHQDFGRELADKTRQAEKRIAAARDEALGHLRAVAAEVAAAATAKLIGVEVGSRQADEAVEQAIKGRA